MHTRKTLIGILSLLGLVWMGLHGFGDGFFHIPLAHAQDDATRTMITTTATLAAGVITGLNFLMWVLFWMLNIVSNPDFIFDPLLMAKLQQLWQFSRDIVNLAFAVLLIIGAILTIVTANTERVKSLLPKFVMAVVLVNFSWFIPRVIFDVAQVMTYSVYQLPRAFTGEGCMLSDKEKCKYVNDIVFLNETNKKNTGDADGGGKWDCTLKPLVCLQLKEMDANFTVNNSQSIIFNGLIVNYARLRTLPYIMDEKANLVGPQGNGLGNQMQDLIIWLIKILVVLVLHIALFFPVLAMVVAFFIRIPILWLTMAFMPFVALGYVLDQLNWLIEKIGKQFLKAAFLPVMVGVPFSIGFTLISVGAKMAVPVAIAQAGAKFVVFQGVNDFWQLFWMMLSLGVLWVGVFAALKGDDYMGHFTDTIQGIGKSMGSIALRAPLSVPIIPSPTGGDPTSIANAMRTFDPRRIDNTLKQTGDVSKIFSSMNTLSNEMMAGKFKEEHVTSIKNDVVINNMLNDTLKGDAAKVELEKKMKELQDKTPELKDKVVTSAQMLEAFLLKSGHTEAQKAKLRGVLANKPPAAPTTPPPAPAPAPTTPPTPPTT